MVFRSSALVIAGAVLATAGAAHAQERVASGATISSAEAGAAVPWYERFTTSSGVAESITGQPENDRQPPPRWELSRHWGVTVGVREAQRIERLPEGGRGDQTSVGAYYQFTPSLRVGGEVSLESRDRPGSPAPQERQADEPLAGVRVESAFRF